MTTGMAEWCLERLGVIEAAARAATPGPWGYNSYAAIYGPDNGYDDWVNAKDGEGHTLEGQVGAADCPICGPWTWDYTNTTTGQVTTYDGRGCRLYSEDYHRDPYVASVPAHHGDTATGRHAADAAHIALHDPAAELRMVSALKRLLQLAGQPAPPKWDGDNYEGRIGGGEHRTCGGRAWCYGCAEWCYPESYACPCCEPPVDPDEVRTAVAQGLGWDEGAEVGT